MYYVEIKTLQEAQEFSHWLREQGKALSFSDSSIFLDWLEQQKFPLEIYLDGITYKFDSQREADFFSCGFQAALNLRINNE